MRTYHTFGVFFVLAGLLFAQSLFTQSAFAQEQEYPLGSPLPEKSRTVQGVDGSSSALGSLTGKAGTVFIFWSNQCPWVDKYKDRVVALNDQYQRRGINFVVVNANDPAAFPQEGAQGGKDQNLPMMYILDTGSQLATKLGATRTPHIFVFDANDALFYAGAIDDSPGDPGNVSKPYLKDALDALLAGGTPGAAKTKAFGCTIKFQQ